MKLLLDTHAFYWWMAEKQKLSSQSLRVISAVDGEVHVSIASAWEMAIKFGSGKWPGAKELVQQFEANVASEQFTLLPIAVSHVRAAGLMQVPHRDPFDRLLAAQATIEGLTLVTADPKVQELGAPWLW